MRVCDEADIVYQSSSVRLVFVIDVARLRLEIALAEMYSDMSVRARQPVLHEPAQGFDCQ